jgi:hypothetical protein
LEFAARGHDVAILTRNSARLEVVAGLIRRTGSERYRPRTIRAIIGNALMPGELQRYLAGAGYDRQLTAEPLPPDAPRGSK